MKARFILAAGAIAAVAAAGSATAASNNDKTTPDGTLTADCPSMGQKQGTITYTGPLTLWPPNHKYRTGTFTVYDQDAPIDETLTDGTMISVTGTHDEILADGSEMNGAGNTDP